MTAFTATSRRKIFHQNSKNYVALHCEVKVDQRSEPFVKVKPAIQSRVQRLYRKYFSPCPIDKEELFWESVDFGKNYYRDCLLRDLSSIWKYPLSKEYRTRLLRAIRYYRESIEDLPKYEERVKRDRQLELMVGQEEAAHAAGDEPSVSTQLQLT